MTTPVSPTLGTTTPADGSPRPILTDDTQWLGVMLIVIIIGLFLAAAVIGPVVRSLKE